MCMMCEEEAMYQAYLQYVAKKVADGEVQVTAEEKAFLEASGFSCDPVTDSDNAAPASPFSRMGPKAQ